MLRPNHDLEGETQGEVHRRLQHQFTDDMADENYLALCEVISDYGS